MTIPTNFYTQAQSLLPQGLQSLISSGQLGPNAPTTVQQPQMPYAQQGQIPYNWNQQAQQGAQVYQGSYAPPQVQAPVAPTAPVSQAPVHMGGQSFGAGVTPAYGTMSRTLVR